MQIHETKYFVIETKQHPHIDRLDGGHIVINPKQHKDSITDLSFEESNELIKLIIACGKAMKLGLAKSGIELWNINYQSNGNFNKSFHFHLYGRSVNAKQFPINTCISHGPKQEVFKKQIEGLTPLTEKDIENIKEELVKLL